MPMSPQVISTARFALLVAFMLLGASARAETGQEKSAKAPPAVARAADTNLVGQWRALTVEAGGKKVFVEEAKNLFVLISAQKLTMRTQTQVVVDTDYTIDASGKAPILHMKYSGRDMTGIFALKEPNLRICLNEAPKDPPTRLATVGEGAGQLLIALTRNPAEQPLVVMAREGGKPHPLVAMSDFLSCGSPDWSPDGQKIAFDAWQSSIGATFRQAHIFIVNSDGTGIVNLGLGAMPSWSPDNKRLAYSQYEPRGVYVMNANGSERKLINAEAWATDWSPTDERIAYTTYARGYNLCVHDLTTHTKRSLLDAPYRLIYWNFAWSHDGNWICFKGITASGEEHLATVHVEGQKKGYKIVLAKTKEIAEIHNGIAWGGKGQPILASFRLKGEKPSRLYLLAPDGEEPPELLAGQPMDGFNTDAAWSPDGKRIVFPSRRIRTPR